MTTVRGDVVPDVRSQDKGRKRPGGRPPDPPDPPDGEIGEEEAFRSQYRQRKKRRLEATKQRTRSAPGAIPRSSGAPDPDENLGLDISVIPLLPDEEGAQVWVDQGQGEDEVNSQQDIEQKN